MTIKATSIFMIGLRPQILGSGSSVQRSGRRWQDLHQ